MLTAAKAAVADAGLTFEDIDGVSAGQLTSAFIYDCRLGPAWQGGQFGLAMVLEAAAAIAGGAAEAVLIVTGEAAVYTERESTAPWTRPGNEFVIPYGLFTAAEFALVARRHMHMPSARPPSSWAGSPPPSATTGTSIPEAIYSGRGPFTVDRHPRVPHGGRPVSPAGLLHDVGRAVAPWC